MELAAEVVARVPERRDGADDLVGHRGGDERAAPGARGHRPRRGSLKFAGAYHGHVDGLLAEAGSGLATQGIPASPGVTEAQAADTVVVPWNDPRVAALGEPRRAIICEPYPANMGLVPPDDGLPRSSCASDADATGALLVFDEVITGFRVARGGAQEREGVDAGPDRPRQGDRRRPAGGGLRRAARADGAGRARPATSTRRARCRGTRWPPPPGLATLRLLDERRLRAAGRADRASSRGGLAEAARDAGVAAQRGVHHRACSRSSSPSRRSRLRGRPGLRPRGARRLLPRRCSTAASTRRRRSSRPGSRRWRTRDAHVERTRGRRRARRFAELA